MSQNRVIALTCSAASVSQCQGYYDLEQLAVQLKHINTRFQSDLEVLYSNNLEDMLIEFDPDCFLPCGDLIDCFVSIASNPIEIARFASLIQDIHPQLHNGICESIAWPIDSNICDIMQSILCD